MRNCGHKAKRTKEKMMLISVSCGLVLALNDRTVLATEINNFDKTSDLENAEQDSVNRSANEGHIAIVNVLDSDESRDEAEPDIDLREGKGEEAPPAITRGANALNNIGSDGENDHLLTSASLQDANTEDDKADTTWMSLYARDDQPIGELSIPGTHDSATYKINGLSVLTKPWTQTQDWPISEQLEHGVRYLDFRIYDDLTMHHGIAWVGENLGYHMDEVVNFLKKHPKDFVMIRLRAEAAHPNLDTLRINLSNLLWDKKYEGFFAENVSEQSRVADVRGKIIFVDDTEGANPIDSGLAWWRAVKQDFFQPESKEGKWEAILSGIMTKKENKELILFNHLSYTQGAQAIRGLADEMNDRFYNYLKDDVVDGKTDLVNLGVIVMDFPSDKLIQQIVSRNIGKPSMPWNELKAIPAIKSEQIKALTVYKGEQVQLEDSLTDLPADSRVEIIESIDTNQVGDQEGRVKVVFSDGSSRVVKIPVKVKDKRPWVAIEPIVKSLMPWNELKAIPAIKSEQIKALTVYKGEQVQLEDSLTDLPADSRVEIIESIDTNQVGDQEGRVKVVFSDGSSRVVKIPVKVKDKRPWVAIEPIVKATVCEMPISQPIETSSNGEEVLMGVIETGEIVDEVEVVSDKLVQNGQGALKPNEEGFEKLDRNLDDKPEKSAEPIVKSSKPLASSLPQLGGQSSLDVGYYMGLMLFMLSCTIPAIKRGTRK